MNIQKLLLTAALVLVATIGVTQAADSSGRVYELRTYYTHPGKAAALQARFRDHTLKLFEKHGMVNVGYWVPADPKDGGAEKLIYLLEHKSREAAKASWKAFSSDAQWQAVRTKSEEGGKIVAKVESVFMTDPD